MAIADTPTLLSLDRFAQIAGLHPMHFNGVYHEQVAPTNGPCNQVLMQHNWQMDDGVSRDEISLAIAAAEEELEKFLGYPIAPKFYDDLVQPVRGQRGLTYTGLYSLPKAYVWSGGVKGLSALGLTQAIVWSDSDSDGYKETGTVVVSNVTCAASEVKIYYPGKSGDAKYQIRPITVTIDEDEEATITFKRELCVKEALLEAYDSSPIDGSDDDNFLTHVDVYRLYTDLSAQAQLFYTTTCYSCAGSGCALCSYEEAEGCIEVVNNRQGMITIHEGTYDSDDLAWATSEGCANCGDIRKARVRYLAGAELESSNKIQTKFELAATRLAMAKLERPICACESITNAFDYWTTDLALNTSDGGSSSLRNISKEALQCPFGTSRAAIWVYNFLKSRDVVAGKGGF